MYTAIDKLREIEREIAMREKLYPRWVAEKKLTQKLAEHRITIFREIADDYAKLVAKDRLL